MITVRAPLRITLGGGGTDLPGWYREHGGFLISAAINKYIYFTGSKRPFDRKIWLSYSSVEVCESVAEIKHELFAKCLAKFDLTDGVELHSISEVPGNTGLGSSGTFLVALLQIMNIMQKRDMTTRDIAELACQIEMVELGRSSGKQDQYVSAFGGIVTMEIDVEGNVNIAPLELDHITRKRLNNNILIYYTGMSRDANAILKEQNSMLKTKHKALSLSMNRIQEIAYESKMHLLSGNLDKFGYLLHEHWEVKKTMADKISTTYIDEIYCYARECGASGGKVIGAGGGGFFMFYVPPEYQLKFRQKMAERGLVEMDWQFDYSGVSKIFSG